MSSCCLSIVALNLGNGAEDSLVSGDSQFRVATQTIDAAGFQIQGTVPGLP